MLFNAYFESGTLDNAANIIANFLQSPVTITNRKYVSTPLLLWFNKESIEYMVINKFKNDFVLNLANNNYKSFEEIAEQGTK